MKRTIAMSLVCGLAAWTGCVFDAEPPDPFRPDDMYVPDVPDAWHQDPIDQEALCAGVMSCDDTLSMRCAGASAGQCYTCCAESAWGLYLTTRCCPTDVIQPDAPDACDVDDGCIEPDPGPDADVPLDVPVDVPVDVPGDDLGPDCGQEICYDCQCDCGGGLFRPYGGCFDDCNPAPDVVANCTLDCSTMCEFVPGQECGEFAGGQECPDGQICVEEPCPNCGVPPRSFCVLPPCGGGGCFIDADCGDAEACYVANISAGEQGVCLPRPTVAGNCWVDAECPAEGSCANASFCDPCFECLAVEQPGHCIADDGVDEVLLWLGATMTAPGSTLIPRWFNFTDAPVFLFGCNTYSIQRQDQEGDWIDLGDPVVCIWAGTVKLDPGDAHTAFPFGGTNLGGEGWTDNFRLRGEYWTGCTEDLGGGDSGCTGGPFEVLSDEVYIGLAP